MERKRHLGTRTQPQRAAPMQAIAATASSARSDPEAGSPEGTLGALGQPCNCSEIAATSCTSPCADPMAWAQATFLAHNAAMAAHTAGPVAA
ncbi:uncharacterized protein LOC144102437 [Amblyomma americanum]